MPPTYSACQRAHYRLAYPVAERPRLLLEGAALPVVDCSEMGLRLRTAGGPVPEPGTRVRGTLVFRRGETEEVEGTVVRTRAGEMAVHLTGRGVPFARIWAEQRRLRDRYPDRFRT